MNKVYVLERITTDGCYTNSFVLNPCFSSLEKSVSYIKNEYKEAKETENVDRAVKSFYLNPNDSDYADFEMIDIYEIEVSP